MFFKLFLCSSRSLTKYTERTNQFLLPFWSFQHCDMSFKGVFISTTISKSEARLFWCGTLSSNEIVKHLWCRHGDLHHGLARAAAVQHHGQHPKPAWARPSYISTPKFRRLKEKGIIGISFLLCLLTSWSDFLCYCESFLLVNHWHAQLIVQKQKPWN